MVRAVTGEPLIVLNVMPVQAFAFCENDETTANTANKNNLFIIILLLLKIKPFVVANFAANIVINSSCCIVNRLNFSKMCENAWNYSIRFFI